MTFNTGLLSKLKNLKQENNLLIYFTDEVTKLPFAINPKYVVGVFVASDDQNKGKTVISMINGSFLIEETQIDVVGRLNGEIND